MDVSPWPLWSRVVWSFRWPPYSNAAPVGRAFIMGLYTILLVVLGGSGVGIFFFGQYLPRETWEDALAGAQILLGLFFLGTAASTWLFNLLLLARMRC